MDNLATYLQPVIIDLAGAAMITGIAIARSYAKAHWNVTISDKTANDLAALVTHGTSMVYAQADAAIDNEALSITDPKIKSAVNNILSNTPNILTKFGITASKLDQLVLAKFGQLQASSGVAVPAAPLPT